MEATVAIRFLGLRPAESAAGEPWAELVAAAAAGDAEGLAALYDAAARELYGFALWSSGRPEVAEDAVQDVFCRLASGAAAGTLVRHPRAWLLTAVRRAAIDGLRRGAREVTLVEPAVLVAAEDPERDAEARAVSRAVAELAPKLREALYLRFFAGLTFAEIGRVLRVPTFTAASRCRLGVARLRLRLGGSR